MKIRTCGSDTTASYARPGKHAYFEKFLLLRINTKPFSIKCTGSNPFYLHRIINTLVNFILE